MIGLIVTGHGNFASGITSSIDLIAGKQNDYVAVDFDGEGTDKLENDLKAALEKLSACDGIIIFCDLAGGSPFKTAVVLTASNPKVKVIAGTNLPMLCEISMARTMINDLDVLVSSALNVGKDDIQLFEIQNTSNDETSDEDGI